MCYFNIQEHAITVENSEIAQMSVLPKKTSDQNQRNNARYQE
jgi:hypothetical protein